MITAMGDASDSDSDVDLGFANLDFTGVDFKVDTNVNHPLAGGDQFALEIEFDTIERQWKNSKKRERNFGSKEANRLANTALLLSAGQYLEVLRGEFATLLFGDVATAAKNESVWTITRSRLTASCNSVSRCVEAELIGIAAFNLFQQLNYTGPSFDITAETNGINPHPCFRNALTSDGHEYSSQLATSNRNTRYHNAVLSELSCDGLWPCQVVEAPYFLLLSRCILSALVDTGIQGWNKAFESKTELLPTSFLRLTSHLVASYLWSARATVAHERLLMTQEPTNTLWREVKHLFPQSIRLMEEKDTVLKAMVLLEFGLACHHFNRPKQGKTLFLKAKGTSGLLLEVTGAEGKRTKFQHKATAQLVVRAASINDNHVNLPWGAANDLDQEKIKSQMIELSVDTILHERVKFEDDDENNVQNLNILDQAILLGLCLDIKDNNPADRLTSEQMSAFLSRVLCHHDDWIVYSTALLERAWLEFDGNHTKERAILQMQALADQHTDRLTITQSTRQSIEESSPVQDRLKNLNTIVYPPRWQMLRDIAERYAQIGIVTSAAEIFTEIEAWDEVVDCYRRAGREKRAEEIVRERLAISETPRMWTALGDITNDPQYYENAVELSRGRFSQAYISLGRYFFEAGDLRKSLDSYRKALKLRPLIPAVWFRVGTISMQLQDWDGALIAFTEVVQQDPEGAEAWANIAAIHMHNKKPKEAYPALLESLKYGRNNWRVWVSKLYTCLDLKKFDEAAQACDVLLDLKISKSSQGVPELEEKCVRAIVGGTVEKYVIAVEKSDKVALDSARRSLVRVQELLYRLESSVSAPWVYEVKAFISGKIGRDMEVLDNLMKEYRSLTSVRAWEKDDHQVQRVCRTVIQIVNYQRATKEELAKSKFLLMSVFNRITQSRSHSGSSLPADVQAIEQLLAECTSEMHRQ